MGGDKVRIVLLIAMIACTIANYATANEAEATTGHKYVTAAAIFNNVVDEEFQKFTACLDQCPQGDEACSDKCAEGTLPKDDQGKLQLLVKARFSARLQFCINGCEQVQACEQAAGGELPSSSSSSSIIFRSIDSLCNSLYMYMYN